MEELLAYYSANTKLSIYTHQLSFLAREWEDPKAYSANALSENSLLHFYLEGITSSSKPIAHQFSTHAKFSSKTLAASFQFSVYEPPSSRGQIALYSPPLWPPLTKTTQSTQISQTYTTQATFKVELAKAHQARRLSLI